jgi:hypothetical protein
MDELKLDRKRSYGTVYNHPGIGFFQDNKPFRHDGTLYVEPSPGEPVMAANIRATQKMPTAEEMPTSEQLTHSEKMKQVWAARKAAEHDATKS